MKDEMLTILNTEIKEESFDMTDTITGTITAVAGTNKSFQLDGGDWYGVYDPSNLQASKGDDVTFEFTRKGKWLNVKGKVVGSGAAISSPTAGSVSSAPVKKATGGRTFPVRGTAPERTINRQNALTNAVQYTNEVFTSATVDEVLDVARQFEAYTCGDLDITEALEEIDKAVAKINGE